MTTKEFLNQPYELDKRIRAAHEQIAVLKDRATRATGSMTALRLGGTSQRSKLEDAADRYIDLESDLDADIVAYHRRVKEVRAVIRQVKQTDLRVLLEYRYLCFMKWEEIAYRIGKGWRWTMRLHGRAIVEAERIRTDHVNSYPEYDIV